MNLIWWWTCFDENWWITDDEGLSMTECPEDWVNLIWWRTCFDDDWWMTDDDDLSMTECPEEWVKLDIEGENEADDFKGCSDLEAGWRKGPSVCLSEGDFNFFKKFLKWVTMMAHDTLWVFKKCSCRLLTRPKVVQLFLLTWSCRRWLLGCHLSCHFGCHWCCHFGCHLCCHLCRWLGNLDLREMVTNYFALELCKIMFEHPVNTFMMSINGLNYAKT